MAKYSFFICLWILILTKISCAQIPDSSYYLNVSKDFFEQKKPENNQYEEFEDIYEIIYLDTAELKPMPEEITASVENTDSNFAKGNETFIPMGGRIQRTPRETTIRFMDELGRNLSINKFQRELTIEAHKFWGEPVKVTMQYYIHWSGKIAGVKLIRYSKHQNINKDFIVNYLKSIDYKKYSVIPERHFGFAVNSINTILIGFE